MSSEVPSPCINVCRMDAVSGWCEGCLRTLDEIAAWAVLPDDVKREVWAELEQRRVRWEARQREPLAPAPQERR
jgi:predicted Fe-S protein YdhL (DUF1289 family)